MKKEGIQTRKRKPKSPGSMGHLSGHPHDNNNSIKLQSQAGNGQMIDKKPFPVITASPSSSAQLPPHANVLQQHMLQSALLQQQQQLQQSKHRVRI